MNRTYALVWNPSLATWTVAHEHARRRGKGAGAVLAAALLLPAMVFAADLPTGGQVASGSGQIGTPSNNQMVIDQASNKLAIDWQSFDIAAGNKVTFHQPGRDAIALNRVLGSDGSKIMGQLDANGRVFIVNPNGVLFGANAQVNVGALVASTLDISNSDFEAGNYRFKGDGSNARVINNGQITAADGGSVALLGGTVSNNGVIVANQGTVALAAGNAVTLDFAGDGLLNVQVDEAVVDALVENQQLIKADGGQVLLTANAGDALLKTVVNNTGVIEAQTLGEKDGKIVLLGSFDGGTVQVAGTLDASAPDGGNGGFIDTSGAHVKVADGAKVTTKAADGKTGTWLIDPTDFTVSAGSAIQTNSGIGATTLSNNLNNTSVTLQTVASGSEDGDINVNAAVTWNAGTTLTLSAHNDININAAITAQNANGKVALQYGQASTDGGTADYHIKAPINLQSGNNFSTRKGSTGSLISYTVVNDANALQAMSSTLGGNYALGSDIDLSSITNWTPVGSSDSSQFTGELAGLGHTLSNLTIDRSSTDYVGLFGYTSYISVIRDIGLVDGSVTGNNRVGGLVGDNYGTISNAYATGSVSGSEHVGGLVGHNDGTISNAYATGSVTGNNRVGGLVGYNDYGTLRNAYATGSVTGSEYVGGLVGYNDNTISNAYATGSVTGSSDVGGLVGNNDYGTISNAYWDSISTEQNNALGGGSGTGTDISSNRYNHSGYTGLGTWALVTGTSNVYAASDSNGVQWIMIEGQTRPFLASEYSTSISNAHQLQLMAYNLGANYTLAGDIDASATAGSNLSDMWSTSGFVPVGDNANKFGGQINGNGHVITGLTIDRSATDYVGLFGYIDSASRISDIGLVGGSVSGRNNVGGLVGLVAFNGATVNNAFVTANVSGADYVGGLAGHNQGTISNAYATGNVSGSNYLGGLAGYNNQGIISNAYATGDVSSIVAGNSYLGGLVGLNTSGTISNAYAIGSVSGNGYVGGLVGYNALGTISYAYTTGSVSGGSYVGGLAGYNTGNISNAYAIGSVSGNGYVGGLVGYNLGRAISNAYATGSVSGSNAVGGLVGYNDNGNISNSFYATTEAGGNAINDSGATANEFSGNTNGTGTTWAQLTQSSTFTGWDIASTGGSSAVWRIYDGYSAPLLRSFLQSITLTADASGGSKTYNGTAATGTTTYTGSDLDTSKLLGTLGYASNSKNAGTYSSADGSLILSGLYSGQQGYDISYADTSLTISKAALAITGISALNKTYDATTHASLTGSVAVNVLGSDIVSVSGTGIGSFADANADSNKAVTVSGYSLTGADAGNYNLLQPTGVTASINKADLTLSGSKVYDGSTSVAGSTLTATGVAGQTFTVTGSGDASNLASKNVQSGSALASTMGLSLGSSSNGGLASNYNAPGLAGSSYTVTAKGITLIGITAADKTYDATTTATLNTAALGYSGVIGGDIVALAGSGSGSFATKNVGTNKTVTVSGYSLIGDDAGNYVVTQPTGLTASVSKANLAVSGIAAVNKTYDATTGATLSGTAAVSALGSDIVSVTGTGAGSFADANAGVGKAVTVTGYALTGSDADNYNLVQPTGLTASINKADLTLSGSKVYDGSTAVAGSTLTATGVAGQTFTVTGSGDASNLASKNVQSGTTLGSATGLTLGSSSNGGLSSNYNLLG
ncbi:hypothetical protein A7D25_23510, partial [Pseudomonas sp. 21C1]|uniref:YDG domain-containing protein n=1 Tax=Pseudomonas sp. 21C1 TaxID=1843690 RepID=UPI00084AD047